MGQDETISRFLCSDQWPGCPVRGLEGKELKIWRQGSLGYRHVDGHVRVGRKHKYFGIISLSFMKALNMKEVLTNQLDKITQLIDISQCLLSATVELIQ